MPPVRETTKKPAAAPTARVTPVGAKKADATAGGQARLAGMALQRVAERQLEAKMSAASPMTPHWMIRAAVISKSEELRTRQELKKDGVTGEHAGHNDIYDAERHGRWMYRLTAEVGEMTGNVIGALKEVWGLIKGAGGSETAMDLHNNEVGRQAALKGGPIPDRQSTGELMYLDPATGKPQLNAVRLKWLFRAKVTAAAAQGAAAALATMAAAKRQAALSGADWWNANQAKYPNSDSLDDLTPPFREKAIKFDSALRAAGADVDIESTLRDRGRAYLMHYSWTVANGTDNPANVPPYAGIDIIWDHGDLAQSRAAAKRMKALFGMAHIAALNSIHIQGRAIDMAISWAGTLDIVDAAGTSHALGAPRNGSENKALHRIGASYGVKKLVSDEPHWSADGS